MKDETLIEKLLTTACTIWESARRQVEAVRAGTSLRTQLRFSEFLAKRENDPTYTLRQHLRASGGAIEE